VISALPLLVPFALLATVEVDSLDRGFSGFLDWFGILTFGLLALIVWMMWIDARVFGMSSRVAVLFQDTEIGFQPTFHLGRPVQHGPTVAAARGDSTRRSGCRIVE